MSDKKKKKRVGRISLAPMNMNQAVDAFFAIKPSDAKKIIAATPAPKKKK